MRYPITSQQYMLPRWTTELDDYISVGIDSDTIVEKNQVTDAAETGRFTGVYQRLGSMRDCTLGDEACFAASDKKRYCKRMGAIQPSVVDKPLDLTV